VNEHSVAGVVAAVDLAAEQPAPARIRGSNTRGQKTRAELVEAATACFSEYGYGKTRIADIVHRAGVSQGNFYRHFTSKKEIFLEALKPGLDSLLESSRRTQLGTEDDVDALVAVTVSYLTAYSRNRHILRVMREAAAVGGEDGFDELWLRLRGSFVSRTEHWLERLHAANKIGEGDFHLLAEALGSMVEQMAYVHLGMPAKTPRAEQIQQIGQVVGEVWHRALPPR